MSGSGFFYALRTRSMPFHHRADGGSDAPSIASSRRKLLSIQMPVAFFDNGYLNNPLTP